jgi:hypothetical protein
LGRLSTNFVDSLPFFAFTSRDDRRGAIGSNPPYPHLSHPARLRRRARKLRSKPYQGSALSLKNDTGLFAFVTEARSNPGDLFTLI